MDFDPRDRDDDARDVEMPWVSTSSRYLKPSKLALHTAIQRIDEQRRANGEAA